MKVKELIQRLQKFDQELEVVFQNPSCDWYEAIIADSTCVKTAIKNVDYEFYYRFVPEELASPEQPELNVQEVLWIS